MQKDIVIRISRRQFFVALTVAFLALSYSITSSETLTLTTYYPAPYGAYKKIVTTDQTILARDSGSVGIGTASPVSPLHVHTQDATGSIITLSGGATSPYNYSGVILGRNSGNAYGWSILHRNNNSTAPNTLQIVKLNAASGPEATGATIRLDGATGSLQTGSVILDRRGALASPADGQIWIE